MPYATTDDLLARVSTAELTLYAPDGAGGIDRDRIAIMLADANAMIDQHLALRYQLPIAHPDTALTRCAVDIARYFLRGDETDSKEVVTLNYNAALKRLDQLAQGAIALQAAGVALPEAPATGVAMLPGVATFGRPNTGGWL